MDIQRVRKAVGALLQYRSDLEFLPAERRIATVSSPMLDQVRHIAAEIAEAFDLSKEQQVEYLIDSMHYGATILDVYTNTGLWLNSVRELAPDLFQVPQEPPPFGFGAHA